MTPLTYFTIAWMLGIALAKWLSPPSLLLFFLAVPAIGGLLLFRDKAHIRFGAINVIALLLGAARLLSVQPAITPGHIAYYNDTDYLLLTAQIIDEPDIRDTYTNLRVQAQRITLNDGQTVAVKGLVLVRAPRYPAYRYGDTLEIFARLETPPVLEDFSYKDYLAHRNIHAMMRRPKIKLLESQAGVSIKGSIYRLKEQAHRVINRILPEPQAALLSGILLGIRSGIPRQLYDDFNATGASHVIVISGSNISLLAAILLLVGQKLFGRKNAAALALLGVAMYTVMVGADPAVVRAALMGALYVLAMYLGRPNAVLNALFVSALAMTMGNPWTLWDAGFQLSFLATLGLIVLVPPLERLAAKLVAGFSGVAGLRTAADLLLEALLVTVAAQIATAPLIIYHFGRFSLVSLLTNLLIVPAQPAVMILGGLAVLVGLVYLPLGQLVGWLAWLPLAWTTLIVEWTAGFTWAQLELPHMPWWLLALAYTTLAAGVWWLNQEPQALRPAYGKGSRAGVATLAAGGAFTTLLLLWAATRALPDGRLHVAFLDVGQGDAILVTTPHGRQMLIDGGPSPAQLGRRLGQQMPFWDHSIDIIVSTHPEADHLTGLVDVIERYTVDTILVSDVEGRSSLYAEWQRQLAAGRYRVITARQGMRVQLDSTVEVVLLNPGPASQRSEALNNHSVTMKVTIGRISVLLAGDIEAPVERQLAAGGQDLSAAIFKSPHHGSNTSSSLPFLEAVNPHIAVISVGKDNRFGHPSPDVLQRYADYGITVLRTDQSGSLEFITDGEQLWLETRQ